MSTTAAQDEFDELLRDKARPTTHPEDRNHDSDLSDPESDGAAHDYLEQLDTDDELEIPRAMRDTYVMPPMRSQANTGPKGVIADAQAFELARKQAKLDETDDVFMKWWRAMRMRDLRDAGQRIRSRTTSPSRRIYGDFPDVEYDGFLKAAESPKLTVIFIYDDHYDDKDKKNKSEQIEGYMREIAERNDTTRFVKFHNKFAEREPDALPSVVAYKNGEVFQDLSYLHHQLHQHLHRQVQQKQVPPGTQVSGATLKALLETSEILPTPN